MRTIKAVRAAMPLGLRIGAPVVVLVVLLAAWQFVASSGAVPTALLPPPGRGRPPRPHARNEWSSGAGRAGL